MTVFFNYFRLSFLIKCCTVRTWSSSYATNHYHFIKCVTLVRIYRVNTDSFVNFAFFLISYVSEVSKFQINMTSRAHKETTKKWPIIHLLLKTQKHTRVYKMVSKRNRCTFVGKLIWNLFFHQKSWEWTLCDEIQRYIQRRCTQIIKWMDVI